MPEAAGGFDELRPREVVRAGLLYCAAAFAVREFADSSNPRETGVS
ncbi:MAG: hypothetical protein JRG89_22760 [Deltaproteobacteria bacterium]|nr:hypothetical protein [Deltaproteobacteria bacterium]MBW2723714.1 hypothetical protein [Deltaproteobacteria bacterium]